MAELGIDSFISSLQHGGLRPNLFQVSIQSPYGNYDDIEFRCKASNIPESALGITILPYMGNDAKLPGNRTYSDWTTTILLDEGAEARRTFEEWHEAMNNSETNISSDRVVKNHMVSGTVTAFNKDGSVGAVYETRGIWPNNVGQVALGWDQKDTVAELEVTWAIQYWVRIK